MDFGQALVKMGGVLRKVMFFAMALPYSDAMFIVAYARECTETFQDGHVRAFKFFGGVPRRISYDNAPTSVSQIIGIHGRKLTDGFLQLQSHYLFKEHFCRVGRANEKGVVEGRNEVSPCCCCATAEPLCIWKRETIAGSQGLRGAQRLSGNTMPRRPGPHTAWKKRLEGGVTQRRPASLPTVARHTL